MYNRKETHSHKLTLKIHNEQNTHHKITSKNTYTLKYIQKKYIYIYIQKYSKKHTTREAGMALYELEPGDNPSESDAYDMTSRI